MKETKQNEFQRQSNKTSTNEIMQQQGKNFYIVRDEINGDTYHWIDKDISLYSSRKLWALIRSVELEPSDDDHDEDNLVELIKGELVIRGHNVSENPWRLPH